MDEDLMDYRPQHDQYREVDKKKFQQSAANPPWWAWVMMVLQLILAGHHFWTFNIQG